MPVWVVRGGRRGEFEEIFMSESVVAIDFGVAASVGDFDTREDLRKHTAKRSDADQLWRFAHEIPNGDMVVLPRKLLDPRVVAVGRVSGDYEFRPSLEAPHIRPVNWIAREIPLADFDLDFQSSFTADSTVYRVRRATDAESRLEKITGNLWHPPIDDPLDSPKVAPPAETGDDEPLRVDIDELITDRILERIRQRFSGTRLERLVASILRASGYHTIETRQGPDGGIDVVAGQGDMGFGHPRLCVQVKSGRNPVDISDYNRLQGNIGSYGADHGLLVSLGDFTRAVRNENERSFFQIRLWGPFDLVDRLLDVYDALPEDIRSEIPLENQKVLMERDD